MTNAQNEWNKTFDKKSKQNGGGLLDSMGGEDLDAKKGSVRTVTDLSKMIPEARKDMNDLKRDRRKRNIVDILKA